MTEVEIITKPLPALRLAAATELVDEPSQIAATVERIFGEARAAVEAVGGSLATPVALYEVEERGMRVTAGYAHDRELRETAEVHIVELPAAEPGACAVHLGEMSRIRESWEALHRGLAARGLQAAGPARELYVRAAPEHDQSAWVTELQIPVAPR